MRLPDFLKDPALNELRARMGAAELGTFRLSVNPYRFTMAELEQLIDAGIDLQNMRAVRPLDDNTLAYKDRRVLLYRRDVPMIRSSRPQPDELPHFHLAYCPIVRRLRGSETASRHAVAAREDGVFEVNLLAGAEGRASLERLPVCEDCLEELHFDGYSPDLPAVARKQALASFTVPRFYSIYHRALSLDTSTA
jgi:hypothetical protein